MRDRLITLSSPSLEQKRAIANAKSAEMVITTALSRLLATWLKRRSEAAQVGVSRLGTIFSTLRLLPKLASVMACRSLFTSENSGAVCPTLGKLPFSCTGLPPSVVLCAMSFSLMKLVKPSEVSEVRGVTPPQSVANPRRSWFRWHTPESHYPTAGSAVADRSRPLHLARPCCSALWRKSRANAIPPHGSAAR